MPMGYTGVQTTLVELPEHFGTSIPIYGVYRPLGGSECEFVKLEPPLYVFKYF